MGALPLSAIGSPHLDELLHEVESAGASAASVNKLRSVLHTVFSKAKKAGKWVGENPVASTERRKAAKRVYATLRAEEVPLLLAEVPAEWRPLFAAALWTGMRRGELFALRKSDVDLSLGTIMVARSNERNTTKGGHEDLIPIAAPLFPIFKHQLEHAPGSLVFPEKDGKQRSPEADPQKILRHALARAGLVEGYEHVCRWCGHKERQADNEQRYCPKCLKRTNGPGKPLAQPRGRALWPEEGGRMRGAQRKLGTRDRLPIPAMQEAFSAYLTRERGLSSASAVSYWFVAARFLAGCAEARTLAPGALQPRHVTEFLLRGRRLLRIMPTSSARGGRARATRAKPEAEVGISGMSA